MTFEEFKALCPLNTTVTEESFPYALMLAETVVQGLMVFSVAELTDYGKSIYNRALALQIDYMATYSGGVETTQGDISSQTINGTTTVFARSGNSFDAMRVSPVVLSVVRGGGLCVR